jgi:DNA polymerase (family 10)
MVDESMENKELARILWETGDLMEIAGEDSFRIRSYRNGATAIEGQVESISSILKDPDRKVTDIPGIGKGLAFVLKEIEETGTCERRLELLKRFPVASLEFLKIQGLGPKGVALLFQHFQITSIDDLEKLCQEHKLRDLPRMGSKLEEKILRSIAQYKERSGRFLLSFADRTAGELAALINELYGIDAVTPAGSLRRGRETVGDLDILVTGRNAEAALEKVATYPRVQEVLGRGANKTSVKLGREGLQVDVRALPRESFGAALQYFTGSKEHNVAIRTRAVKMGLTLNEYGLFQLGSGERVAGETEQQVYQALGLDWIPPEMRENQGEIELAAAHNLPLLVELGQIRGDLHMHTLATDGKGTLEEMAEAARALGYEYIAITDHSKALAMANGLDETRVVAFARQVRDLDHSGLGIRVFSGLECDIMKDGTMDIASDALAELDFVIGSVHNNMSMESAEMTERLLRALECPWLRVLGHPTGRLLLQREGFPFDFERVVDEAVRRGVALEINSNPERLDLNAQMARAAKARGARFTISTDAHHPSHLLGMRFGVTTARRAWLSPSDILNTLPLDQFTATIKR